MVDLSPQQDVYIRERRSSIDQTTACIPASKRRTAQVEDGTKAAPWIVAILGLPSCRILTRTWCSQLVTRTHQESLRLVDAPFPIRDAHRARCPASSLPQALRPSMMVGGRPLASLRARGVRATISPPFMIRRWRSPVAV